MTFQSPEQYDGVDVCVSAKDNKWRERCDQGRTFADAVTIQVQSSEGKSKLLRNHYSGKMTQTKRDRVIDKVDQNPIRA